MSCLCTVEVRFTEMRQTVSIRLFPSSGQSAVIAPMLTPKRPRAAPESTTSKLSKYSSSSAASVEEFGACPRQRAVHPNPVGCCPVMSMPVIVVLSVLTAIGHWRQVSPVSAAAKSFVDIRTARATTFFLRQPRIIVYPTLALNNFERL